MGCLASKDRLVAPVNDKAIVKMETESTRRTCDAQVTVCEVSSDVRSVQVITEETKPREQSHRPSVMRPKTRCIMVRKADPSSTVDNTTTEAITFRPRGSTANALPLPPTEEEFTGDVTSSRLSILSDSDDSTDGSCYEEREITDLVVQGKRILPPLILAPLPCLPVSGGPAIKKIPLPLPKLKVNAADGDANGTPSSHGLSAVNGARLQDTADQNRDLPPLPPNYCSALWSRSEEEFTCPERGAAGATLFDSVGRIIAEKNFK